MSSIDERIARDFVLAAEADVVINILDASNLERNLYLTIQLLEMRVPMVVALNMLDVAEDRRIRIDVAGLAARLGCPVVPLVANRGDGVDQLRTEIDRAAAHGALPLIDLAYRPEIEDALTELLPAVEKTAASRRVDPRWLAIKLLEGDEGALAMAPEACVPRPTGWRWQRATRRRGLRHPDRRQSLRSRQFVDPRGGTSRRRGRADGLRPDRPGGAAPRCSGIPIFLAVMYLLFLFTINIGSAFIDFFDPVHRHSAGRRRRRAAAPLGSPEWLTALLADGVGGGIQTVATFIPIIGCLFLFLSFLEDSGYMARAAFVMDRLMRSVGLPGKSFIPLIVGFGCNVPAIMATRTLENSRDRIMTVIMAPFMSCGARLPVYALFAAAFFPVGGQNLVFALYLIGIAVAVMTGLILKTTVLKGETAPFIMELPPYHLPRHRQCADPHLGPAEGVRAARRPGDRRGRRRHRIPQLLGHRRQLRQPGQRQVGAGRDRQEHGAGVRADGDRREQLAGDGRHLHRHPRQGDGGGHPGRPLQPPGGGRGGGRSGQGRGRGRQGFDLWAVGQAFATIPANLAAVAERVTDPLGLTLATSARWKPAADQEVAAGTFGAMAARFDGAVGAFAYLLLSCSTCPASRPSPPSTVRPTCVGRCSSAPGPRASATLLPSCSIRPPPSAAIRRPRRLGCRPGILGLFALSVLAMRASAAVAGCGR